MGYRRDSGPTIEVASSTRVGSQTIFKPCSQSSRAQRSTRSSPTGCDGENPLQPRDRANTLVATDPEVFDPLFVDMPETFFARLGQFFNFALNGRREE